MITLLYRDGVAIDAIVVPDTATIAEDHRSIALPDDMIPAPAGAEWHIAPEGGAIGWVLDAAGVPCAPPVDLAKVKADKVAVLRAACAAAIVGGFESAALGEARTYPSSAIDQDNAKTAAIGGGGSLWCALGETWSLIGHTAAQATRVVTDFSAHRSAASEHLALLTAEVEAAATAEAVAAIVWG